MKIQFKIDPERLTLGDLITLEDFGSSTWKERRVLLANSLVDDDGNFYDHDEAMKILTDVSLLHLNDAAGQFLAAVRGLMNNQLPPQNGSS